MKVKTVLTVVFEYEPKATHFEDGIIPSKEELIKDAKDFAENTPEDFISIPHAKISAVVTVED